MVCNCDVIFIKRGVGGTGGSVFAWGGTVASLCPSPRPGISVSYSATQGVPEIFNLLPFAFLRVNFIYFFYYSSICIYIFFSIRFILIFFFSIQLSVIHLKSICLETEIGNRITSEGNYLNSYRSCGLRQSFILWKHTCQNGK